MLNTIPGTPQVTATTPGDMPVSEYAKTSAITLAQAQDFGAGDWAQQQRIAMKAAAPGVSNFLYWGFRDMIKVAAPTIGGITATVSSASVAGGGLSYVTSGAYAVTPTLLVNPRIQPFAFSFRGAFPTPVNGQHATVAFDYGGNESMGFESYYEVSEAARTKLVVQSTATASVLEASDLVIDGLVHTYTFAWDLTDVKFRVDGTVIKTITNASNNIQNNPCKMIIAGRSMAMVITDLLFAY